MKKTITKETASMGNQGQYARRLTRVFIVVALILSGFISAITFLSYWPETFKISFFIFILNSVALLLDYKEKNSIAVFVSLISILLGGTYAIATGDGLFDSAMMLFPGVIILASMAFNRNLFITFSSLTISIVILVGIAQINGLILIRKNMAIEGLDLVVISIILIGIIITIRQISSFFQKSLDELKKNEEVLSQTVDALQLQSKMIQKSEARWRSLVENAPDMILNIEKSGTILFSNRAKVDIKNESGLTSVYDLIPKKQHKIIKDSLDTVFNKNESTSSEIQMINPAGDIEWYMNRISPVIQNEKVVSAILISSNISDRKKALEDLAKSEEKYKHIFENVQDIYCELALDGIILEISPAVENISSYKRTELMGKPVFNLIADEAKSKQFIEAINEKGRVTNFEVTLKDKNGEIREFAINATFVIDNSTGDKKIVISLRDITENKKLMEQLLQAQKMDSIGTLAGGIAHDFNNLLTVINGHSQLAELKLDKESPVNEDLQAILTAGERAAALTKQILAFSRKQLINPEVIDLNLIVSNMEPMIGSIIGEIINFETDLDKNIQKIIADRGQIEQVIINLIINARDAINSNMEESNTRMIRIDTSTAFLDEDFEQAQLFGMKGKQSVLTISDTGVGMEKDTQSYIFEPFFTTKETGQGTGLGLSMVYGIVKQNNGSIYVYSEKAKGTLIKIYWPASEENEVEKTLIEPKIENYIGNETILLVEDDDAVRKFALLALKSQGYNVWDLPNGPSAIKFVKKEKKEFDLLVTDMIMPNMSGSVLAKEMIKIKGKDLKILYTSGYTDSQLQFGEVSNKEINFLNKPYSTIELSRKIREILDS